MLANELRKLPEKELLAKVEEIRAKMFQLGFKAGTEDVTNPAEMRVLRRDIARAHQIMSERKKQGAPKKTRLGRAARTIVTARAERKKLQAPKPAAAKPVAAAKAPKAPKAPAKTPVAEKKA